MDIVHYRVKLASYTYNPYRIQVQWAGDVQQNSINDVKSLIWREHCDDVRKYADAAYMEIHAERAYFCYYGKVCREPEVKAALHWSMIDRPMQCHLFGLHLFIVVVKVEGQRGGLIHYSPYTFPKTVRKILIWVKLCHFPYNCLCSRVIEKR